MENEIYVFDPVKLSYEENEFLLENLGKPTVVAMKAVKPGVNPAAVRPILARVTELEELSKHEGAPWVGIEAMKEAIATYLREDSKWAAEHDRNKKAPRFPSLFSFDSKGRAHRGGPGSDAGQVRTYFDARGKRLPFALPLIESEGEWIAPAYTEQPEEKGMHVNADANRIECSVKMPDGQICGHTEAFKADSRASFNAARARFSKHLRKATENVEDHRELHTLEFGSAHE